MSFPLVSGLSDGGEIFDRIVRCLQTPQVRSKVFDHFRDLKREREVDADGGRDVCVFVGEGREELGHVFGEGFGRISQLIERRCMIGNGKVADLCWFHVIVAPRSGL